MGNLTSVGPSELASLLREKENVVIDFWAPWCAPCLRMEPILDAAAVEHGRSVAFAKLNVDDHPDVMQRNGVMGLPTLVLFRKGQRVASLPGFQNRASLEAALAQAFR